LRYIYIVNKITKKREQNIMSRFCDACDLASKNNDKLTHYLIKYQVIQKTKRQKEFKSKKKIKKNLKKNLKKTIYISCAIVFLK